MSPSRVFVLSAGLTGVLVMSACSSPAAQVGVDLEVQAPDTGLSESVTLPEVAANEEVETLLPAPDAETSEVPAEPACKPGEGCFLDPCEVNEDCLSGFCVEHLGETVCTSACQEECPAGWSCRLLGATGPDPVFVCLSDHANLCKPCNTDADCSTQGSDDVCLRYGPQGSFCGGGCVVDDDCPWGFSCAEAETVGGTPVTQCVSDLSVCPCSAHAVEAGLWTGCQVTNEWGTCTGKRTCTEAGLADCDAAIPAEESCNGMDDDCDGDTDEPLQVGGDYVNLCDDGNECTTDVCGADSGCSHQQLDGGECKDGDACTVGDHCEAGQCLGNPVLCDDENPCTDDSCDGTGGCLFESNAAGCDDGNPCTVGDTCSQKGCSGIEIPCDCQNDVDCAPLEDGDLCNGTLFCDLAKWPYQCRVVPESPVVCPEPAGVDSPCLDAACDPVTGACSLIAAHEGAPCDDGDACTVGEHCSAGTCAGSVAANCADDNPCTDDSCDAATGCQHQANAAPCEDASLCTVGDVCANGSCSPGAKALGCDDSNPCTADSCDAKTGCIHVAAEGACDDGNACTQGDSCQAGGCVPGAALACKDDNVCTTESCDPKVGCVFTMNQVPCDDGSLCTQGDHCELGACIGGFPLACTDSNLCTDDGCEPKVGCTFKPNQAACNDGSACTAGDVCSAGWCKAGPLLDCDDDNGCTDDSCDPKSGCVHTPNTLPCEDGDQCTASDHCGAGSCIPGGPAACDDANPCTDDSCDKATGCKHASNTASCDDGDACTTADKCAGGLCSGGPALGCDDANPCTDDSCDKATGCKHASNSSPCPGGLCVGGTCVPECNPVVYGTAGIGVNNGWTCSNVCSSLGGTTVNWNSMQEQIDYCQSLHPGASSFAADPNNFSYPIYEPQNNLCKVNKDGKASQNYQGNGTPQYGDQILCRCLKSCPCTPKCAGKECGDNGCGGLCGTCQAGKSCQNGLCVACPADSTTFSYSGSIASWAIPACVSKLTIEAWGAEGGKNSDNGGHLGGKGARMKGTFTVAGGTNLKILVGGKGEDVLSNAGGGGGSFVWVDGSNTLLIAAGGGGGAGYDNAGIDAVTSNGGTHGNGLPQGGGVDGNGGTAPSGYEYTGGGGAGWKSNGNPGHTTASCSLATPARRPLEGGDGGLFGGTHANDGNGGFGGGGGGQGGCTVSGGAGGGGGYSGGGPGGYLSPLIRGGGGGGSYNNGTNPSNSAGVQTGNGKIVISW